MLNQADHGLQYLKVGVEDIISGSVKLPNGGRDCIDVLRNTQAQAGSLFCIATLISMACLL